MANKLTTIVVISLFMLLPSTALADGDDSSSTETLPDLLLEPAWDENIPWSNYLGSHITKNKPSFNVTNIGTGELPDECRENCTYFIWIDEGTDHSRNWTYSFSTMNMTALFDGETQRMGAGNALYGNHSLRACIDALDIVNESDEENNCWEGNLTVLPDLRWYQGNPDGTFEDRGDWTYDAPEGLNDVYLQQFEDDSGVYGKIVIKTGYASNYSSYGGELVNWSVTLDGEPLEWNRLSSWGTNYSNDSHPGYYRIDTTGVVRVCFDPLNLINETNEENNCIEKTLVVTKEESEGTADEDTESSLPAPSAVLTVCMLSLAAIILRENRKNTE